MANYDYLLELQRFDRENDEATGLNLEKKQGNAFYNLTMTVALSVIAVCERELNNPMHSRRDKESYAGICTMMKNARDSMKNDEEA